MEVRYGERLKGLPPSGTLRVGREVAELRGRGVDVINLGGGLPDPQPDVLAHPITFPEGKNAVGSPAGEMDLRTALARHLHETNDLDYDAGSELVVTVGAKHGVYATLLAVLDPGDEVVVFDPSWVTYGPAVEVAGGVAVQCPFLREGGFGLDEERLSAAVSSRTRAIILNSPHNPTGRVLSRSELASVAKVAEAHDLWVISDESFDKFVFDEHEHVSIASLPDMRRRTIVLRSFSKAYAIPGCRVGYIAAPPTICSAVSRFNEHTISCVSPLMQQVALRALEGDPQWAATIKSRYQSKRDKAFTALADHPSLVVDRPEGTFYLFVNIERLKMTSQEVARRLLHEAAVGVTPGTVFGNEGEGFIRLNLVGPQDRMEVGLERLVRAL